MKSDQDKLAKIDNKSIPKSVGIAGWLIIPGLGLVLAPIKSLVMFIIGIKMIQNFTPELLGDLRLWISGLIDITLIISTIVIAVLFFKKLRIAIKAIIGLLVATIVATVIQAFLNMSMFGEVDSDLFKPILQTLIFSSIWIPYFLKSKRVENTFVK